MSLFNSNVENKLFAVIESAQLTSLILCVIVIASLVLSCRRDQHVQVNDKKRASCTQQHFFVRIKSSAILRLNAGFMLNDNSKAA